MNITDYESDYIKNDFECYMVKIRQSNVLDCINKYKHDNILEVGCGTDLLFKQIVNLKKYTIVESSEYFCNIAKKECSPNIKVINSSFEDYADSFEQFNDSFDVVILSSILHLIEDLDTFLKALKKVISKKTLIYINVPNINSLHRLIAIEIGLISNISEKAIGKTGEYKKHFFSESSLTTLLIRNNFKIINSGSYFIKPFSHRQMLGLLDKNIIEESVVDGLYKISKYFPNNGAELFFEIQLDD
jgi:2-polyprenyl-3-methyl-5-hydroxy-6-metoxy-1,4-benzoquinol methylase